MFLLVNFMALIFRKPMNNVYYDTDDKLSNI